MSSKKFVNVQNKRNEFWRTFEPLVVERFGYTFTDNDICKLTKWPTTQKVVRYRSGENTPKDNTLRQLKLRLKLPEDTYVALSNACKKDIDRKKNIRPKVKETAPEVIENKELKASTRTRQADKIDTVSDVEGQIISIDMGVDMVGLDEAKVDEIATELIRWGNEAGAKPEEINQRVKGFYKLIEQLKTGQVTVNRDLLPVDKQKKS